MAARVNGAIVSRTAVDRVVRLGELSGSPVTKKAALEQAISEELIAQEAGRLKVSVPAKAVQQRLDALATSVGGEQTFDERLAAAGLTLADVRVGLVAVMLAERVQAVRFNDIEATRAQAVACYQQKRSLFTRDATVRLATIVVRTKAQALDVIARIRAGLSFATAARQFSRDLESRRNGGMLGWADVSSLPSALGTETANLSIGELSAPVDVGPLWYVLRLYGRRPASTIPFDEVGAVIRDQLTAQQRAAALARWLKAARARAEVEITS